MRVLFGNAQNRGFFGERATLRSLKVDNTRLSVDTPTIKFATAGPAELVLDIATKAPKADENRTPLYSVPVSARDPGVKDSIKVSGDVTDEANLISSKPPRT